MADTPPQDTPWRHQGDDLRLAVRVQPRASRTRLGEHANGRLRVYLSAPPTDGRANTQLIELIAKAFGVAKSRVHLLRGAQSRNKDLLIESPGCLPSLNIPAPD
ncbi:hypothetical protein BI364_01330 [Acidihalobacter yilgarnensis]|uniref:UPF0235 protein BI364_01330 n=1 Tax=Acidihalobacter yilgarnensis TaxID=2819280 RepID=A0A1D8IK43_9GAMM|nr:DUF167 domain-containing protein [Acidihalobacter yilgarnensis]AOU96826.1 hypothetical protein BI364_01330 [Acidihalobacter yilgarnensis]